jgi:CheY-like chemotaxis protein
MPKRILLADDSITIQKVVELTFSDGDYEVTAVNNGAKAVQKLAEMRPDIILSDIIMPEKNGYEVCEYVKSHPEFRSIPVVLLTGTFEPFDPDRAEKAGCDAVVTKPFESQSLIHKVEELIAQAQNSAPAPEPQAAPSPWMEEAPATPSAPAPSPFSTATGTYAPPFTHDADIFGAAPAQGSSASEMTFEPPPEFPPAGTTPTHDDTPFGAPPLSEQFSGETKAFPKMSFDEMQQMASEPASAPPPPPPPPAHEPSPWDEGPEMSGETRAFTKMTFDDLPAPAPASQPEPEPESPFGAPPPAETFSSETRAFTQMSMEEMRQLAQPKLPPEPPSSASSESSPWDEPAGPAFGEEPPAPAFSASTNAFPELSLDQPPQFTSAPPPAPEPEPEPPAAASPWDDQPPAFAGETKAFPKMSFDELSQMASSTPEPVSEPEPSWEPPAPSWSTTADTSAMDEPASVDRFATAGVPPFEDSTTEAPFSSNAYVPPAIEELSAPEPEAEPEPEPEPEPAPPSFAAPEPAETAAPAMAVSGRDLTDEQVDRIARRVVELMSVEVVRNIAWEVVPDLAEMVVKERIRQLEAE